MGNGTRRLLDALAAFGRMSAQRPTARERLELEVGPMMARALLSAAGGRLSTGSARRRRRVA
jgi:hypothetical protein